MLGFTVIVAMVGEGEHKPSEEVYEDVVAVSTGDDGRLEIIKAGGNSASLSATSWGAFKVIRVASAGSRI